MLYISGLIIIDWCRNKIQTGLEIAWTLASRVLRNNIKFASEKYKPVIGMNNI
jgi:hypothetical protein